MMTTFIPTIIDWKDYNDSISMSNLSNLFSI